jgi:hypothetical protein
MLLAVVVVNNVLGKIERKGFAEMEMLHNKTNCFFFVPVLLAIPASAFHHLIIALLANDVFFRAR